MFRRPSLFVTAASSLVVIAASSVYLGAGGQAPAPAAPAAPAAANRQTPDAAPAGSPEAVVRRYCMGCHNSRTKSGNLSFTDVDLTDIGSRPDIWERVMRKVGAGMMPPAGMPRPDQATMDGFLAAVGADLDRAFTRHPDPGRTEPLHRLNRTEYANAIRDLLAVEIDAAEFLPADDASYGFDNMAGVLRLSEALMERYLSAAKTIARMAVGTPLPTPDGKTYRIAPDVQQHDRVDGLPFGTRGGMLVTHLFPQTGNYEFKIEVAGAAAPKAAHTLELTVDGEQVKTFEFAPVNARGPEGVYEVDGKLEVTLPVSGGPHDIGLAFYRKPADLVEQVREPFPNPRISGNDGGPGGSMPVVTNMSIIGPYESEGPGSTPSRQRIFVCRPQGSAQETSCARTVIERLARRAYRGNVAPGDLETLLAFYDDGRKDGGSFDAGIEAAIRRMLVDPNFLFRIETAPSAPGTRPTGATARAVQLETPPGVYPLSDLELASRLSFFLWSSIPDDELLDLASRGRLKDPAVLEQQVKRMLNDPRSVALTKNFAGQWLLIRNIATVRPGDPFSLAFDETLRQAMNRESELFFDSVIRENRPVTELLTARYTFLNERLAAHYGIPGVQGNHFRRVELPADSPRGGILGQGSVLTVTSHAIRTSPVLRGKWILNNILGAPPPDPPPNVPALPEQRTQAKTQTMRQRMAAHRANPVCATCHNMIDPAGFALENFDAIGRWRTVDESFNPIDASGQLPDGSKFNGVADLKKVLTARPERFTKTVAEKMLTYALGRGLEYYDMPAVRHIVADAARDDYRFQSLILGIVRSYPFTMRRAEPAPPSGTSAAH